jgi:hypothetical protein
MVLAMTRPYKHSDAGIYWFGKRVPDALRELVGKRYEKFSLRTRDPSEARVLLTKTLVEGYDGQIVLGQSIIPGGNPAPVFQTTEQAFDDVSPLVSGSVEWIGFSA